MFCGHSDLSILLILTQGVCVCKPLNRSFAVCLPQMASAYYMIWWDIKVRLWTNQRCLASTHIFALPVMGLTSFTDHRFQQYFGGDTVGALRLTFGSPLARLTICRAITIYSFESGYKGYSFGLYWIRFLGVVLNAWMISSVVGNCLIPLERPSTPFRRCFSVAPRSWSSSRCSLFLSKSLVTG